VIGHALEIVILTQDDGPVAARHDLRAQSLPASLSITTGREKIQYALRQLGKHMQIWRINAICVDDCQNLLRNIIRHLPLPFTRCTHYGRAVRVWQLAEVS